ncbi:phosphonatase-like hydrolase [Mycetocola sp.]|uniref:phosphonatase-like hydrolase n=1 Tax=Mycetocola sp. TaxID=1871042 RepID=UPI00398997DD
MTTFDDIILDDTEDAGRSDAALADEELETIEIELVVLDMAGTTVKDDGVVERAFQLAAERSGITRTEAERADALAYVRATMGQSKIDVFRVLADTEEDAVRANDAFEMAYGEIAAAEGVAAIDGAEDVLRELREAGVKIALTTGFSRGTQDVLLDALGWNDLVDLTLSPADAGRGRPFPDLPLTALLRTSVSRVDAVVVVGDTASDMLSGSAAGAGLVVGVLTGAHDAATLEEAGADVILNSIADLPAVLGLR